MSLLILAGVGGKFSWVGVFFCYYFYFSFPAYLEEVVLSSYYFFFHFYGNTMNGNQDDTTYFLVWFDVKGVRKNYPIHFRSD